MAGTKKKSFKKIIRENYTGWLFAMPVILGILIFLAWPIVQSLVYSFHKYDGITKMEWYGFKNYIYAFSYDKVVMGKIVANTLIYTVCTIPLNIILGFFVALLLNKKIKGIYGFRVLYYLPVMIPAVAGTILWRDIFEYNFGIMNQIFSWLGIKKSGFFYTSNSAMITVILLNIWSVGGGMVLWLAAMKNVPVTLYESASLDGARWYHKLFKITVPMCTPMIFYNIVTSVIGTLQVFHIYMMVGGVGPKDSLFFYAVKIYLEAFTSKMRMGYASALAWMLFIVIAVLTVILFLTSKWVYYGEEE